MKCLVWVLASISFFAAHESVAGCGPFKQIRGDFTVIKISPLTLACEDQQLKRTGETIKSPLHEITLRDSKGKQVHTYGDFRKFTDVKTGDKFSGMLQSTCCENVYAILCDGKSKQNKEMLSNIDSISCHEDKRQYFLPQSKL